MSVIATAVKHLMAAGVTGDALLAAIEDIEAQLSNEPKPRSAGAIRQARYEQRKRQKASEMTKHDVSDGNDACDETAENVASYRVTPVTPKGVTAPTGARRNRGSRITTDWTPPPVADLPPEAQALATQWPAASYRAESEAFVNFWIAEPGARASKNDWTRAWANRIVQIHSKVMRDQKFAARPPANDGNSFLDHMLAKQAAAP